MKLPIRNLLLLALLGGGLFTVPTMMLLGARSPVPPAKHYVAERGRDYDDFLFQLEIRRLQSPTPAPAVTAAAPSAGAPAPSVPRLQPSAAPVTAPASGALPAFSHVFTIVMENHEFGGVIGNPAAPYINGLAASYGLATNYYAVSHPSLPNYLALTAGSTFGIASDCTSCYVNAPNIADEVEASGRSWKAYMEGMPSPCYAGAGTGGYAMKHNPFAYYNDIRLNAVRCTAHVVPFTQFSADLASGQVPNYVWITPDMCDDMHDCAPGTGDAWLRNVVPSIMSSAAFRNGGVLFITFDEGASNAGCCGDASGGRVATLVISPMAVPGMRSATAENHYSLLRTIEDAWHLGRLGASSWQSSLPMREYFRR